MILLGLTAILLLSISLARLVRKTTSSTKPSVLGFQTVVRFLESLNALPPELSDQDLYRRLLSELRQVLGPFGVHSRLWIANPAWKTMQGYGEHPAKRPGSPQHLPMSGCPAYVCKAPFGYTQSSGEPCASEQFNYTRHLCIPLLSEEVNFGVLFLGSYSGNSWHEEETHLFRTLTHAIALTLQRHALFHRLGEKLGDLRFSFEVGAAALATFSGSTQGIEETTVHILDSVLGILNVDRASLMLWDHQAKVLQTQWARGGDFKIESPLRLAMGEGMAGWALKTGNPYWAEYAMGDPHYLAGSRSVRSLICVPVFTMSNTPLGVINAMTTETPRTFLPREIDFLVSFGRQAALAIENARLHQKSRLDIDQLNEINKLKSHFLSLVSHDLRGPLTGIRGFCEVLKLQQGGPLTANQLDLIGQMERQVQLQERMVEDLVDLARMEKDRLTIHKSAVDITQLIQEEVDKAKIEAQERNLTLRLVMDIAPTHYRLYLDGARIRQVIWNLIFNALKFTPEEGRVSVRARVEQETLWIDVEDTGVGLAREAQERVFEKFFQVSPGGSTSAQGLGLGLAICKEIVCAHGGTIRARSEGLGRGTTISFSLPVRIAGDQGDPQTLAA